MRGIILAIAVLAFCSTRAQVVTIKKVELAGPLIIVHYDLEDSNPNNEYLLNLYTSKDNFAAPLTKVAGDVGLDIKPGTGKKIEWSIREEYGGYKGKLSLEIRGKVYVPFVRLQNFDTKKSYRKGKSHAITWKAGNSNPVNIELFKGGQRISGEVNNPNNGSYSLFIPAHATKGKDYRLKFSDSRNSEEVIYTGYFKVTPKVPLWLKVVPVVAVAGGVAAFAGGKDKTGPGLEDIVGPPALPGN